MPEEEIKEAPREEARQIDSDAIAQLVQALLDQGASPEEVLGVVEQAVQGGDLPAEAIDIAKQLLEADEQEGRRLFGLEGE